MEDDHRCNIGACRSGCVMVGLGPSPPGRGTPEVCCSICPSVTFEFIMQVGVVILCISLWCAHYEPMQEVTVFEESFRSF